MNPCIACIDQDSCRWFSTKRTLCAQVNYRVTNPNSDAFYEECPGARMPNLEVGQIVSVHYAETGAFQFETALGEVFWAQANLVGGFNGLENADA